VMNFSIRRSGLIAASAILSIAVAAPEARAAGCSAQNLVATYQQSNSPQEAARTLAARLDHAIKPSKALKDMMAGVSNGTLTKEVQKAVHVRTSYKIDPRTLRSSKMGRYFRSLELTEQPALPRLSTTFKAFTGLASAAHFLTNLEAAISTGDRNAILDMNKQAFELSTAMTISRAGMNAAKLGSAVAGFLDYALTSLMVQELTGYEEYWWNAYSAYLNSRYPKMVSGNNSWANLAMRQDKGRAFQARLYEFWATSDVSGDGIETPLERATHYYKAPKGLRRGDALAMAKFQKTFAARYYGDYLKTTLDTFMKRKATAAKDAAASKFGAAAAALCSYLGDMESLARDVQKLKTEQKAGLTDKEKAFFKQCNQRLAAKSQAKKSAIAARDNLTNWRNGTRKTVNGAISKLTGEIDELESRVKGLGSQAKSLLAGASRDEEGRHTSATKSKFRSIKAKGEALNSERNNKAAKQRKYIKAFNSLKKVSNKNCSQWVPKYDQFSSLVSVDVSRGSSLCQSFKDNWAPYQQAHDAMNEIGKQCNAVAKKKKKLASQKN